MTRPYRLCSYLMNMASLYPRKFNPCSVQRSQEQADQPGQAHSTLSVLLILFLCLSKDKICHYHLCNVQNNILWLQFVFIWQKQKSLLFVCSLSNYMQCFHLPLHTPHWEIPSEREVNTPNKIIKIFSDRAPEHELSLTSWTALQLPGLRALLAQLQLEHYSQDWGDTCTSQSTLAGKQGSTEVSLWHDTPHLLIELVLEQHPLSSTDWEWPLSPSTEHSPTSRETSQLWLQIIHHQSGSYGQTENHCFSTFSNQNSPWCDQSAA